MFESAAQAAARFGGDEFVILLEAIVRPNDVAEIAKKVINRMQQPFQLACGEVFVGASIGITIYPEDAGNAETLVRNADMAMYQAKHSEQHQFSFYSEDLTESTIRRWSLENDLRNALEKNCFSLVYQPKVDSNTEHISGVEALIRWNRGDQPPIFPNEFIPVAEETGLIIPLGRWVIQQAVRQLRAWQETACAELTIAVNVSGRQLYSDKFPDYVASVLEQEGVSAGLLEIEITENHLVPSNQEGNCQETLRRLSDLGIKMSIDDFGTGYSSFSQLKNLPISTLKVDKSFVDHIPEKKQDVAIIKSILSLAQNLGLKVVAEGVETIEQLTCIRSYGCDFIQGYYYSKPISADEIAVLLEGNRCKWALPLGK